MSRGSYHHEPDAEPSARVVSAMRDVVLLLEVLFEIQGAVEVHDSLHGEIVLGLGLRGGRRRARLQSRAYLVCFFPEGLVERL